MLQFYVVMRHGNARKWYRLLIKGFSQLSVERALTSGNGRILYIRMEK